MNKFKTALVYPSYVVFNLRGGLEGTWINHGIACLIAYAKKMGETVDLIDLRRLKDWNDFKNKIKKYDLVGYSILTQDMETARQAINLNKQVNPQAKIVVGGVHVSVATEDFINDRKVDFIIIGEGEIVFCNLIKRLKSNSPPHQKILEDKRIDLNELPYIDRDLWTQERPAEFVGLKEPFFTLLGSRACIYNCRFCQPCSRKIFGTKERVRSPEHFIGELVELKKTYGLKSFIILDDNAFQNRNWIENVLMLYDKLYT